MQSNLKNTWKKKTKITNFINIQKFKVSSEAQGKLLTFVKIQRKAMQFQDAGAQSERSGSEREVWEDYQTCSESRQA